MGDVEYEALKVHFEKLPQHFRAAPSTYTLVHAITPLEENKSFLEKVELGERLCGIAEDESFILERSTISEDNEVVGDQSQDEGSVSKDAWRNSPTWDFLLQQRSPRLNIDPGSDSDNERCVRHSSGDVGTSESDNDIISNDDRLRIMETERRLVEAGVVLDSNNGAPAQIQDPGHGSKRQTTRRHRRKLPEIPKHKKPLEGVVPASIFEELSAATPSWVGPALLPGQSQDCQVLLARAQESHVLASRDHDARVPRDHDTTSTTVTDVPFNVHNPASMILNLANLDALDEPVGDADSGMSTSHSPEDNFKQFSRQDQDTLSPVSPAMEASAMATRLELLDPTHRGLHRFVPRHRDEILVDIGDPVYVHIEAEDGWCEGINLRTGDKGIFPLAHVVDVEYNDFDPAGVEEKKERYLLDYLGSVQCAQKGVEIIVQSVIKMSGKVETNQKTPCVLEISDKGIKMVDKSKPGDGNGVPSNEYFYNLKNVTFCGFHPRDHRYFGFITKHPSPCLQKHACHVFVSESSTRCVAQAYGRAFRRFYQKFIETAFPTEDIYLE